MVSWITSNGAGDVRQKSHEQRHRRRTICFVKIVNGTGVLQYVFWIWAKKKIGYLIGRELRAGYINAKMSAKKNVKITADVWQKTCPTVKKAYE